MAGTSFANRPPGLFWLDYLKTPTPSDERIRRRNLSKTLARTLDRTAVLGNDDDYGHQGYVSE
jgi:hypothetical protein